MTDTNQTQHQGESQDQQQDKTANDALLVQLQAEVERLRKHSETLLAEKSNKANSEKPNKPKKSDLPKRQHAKKAILRH